MFKKVLDVVKSDVSKFGSFLSRHRTFSAFALMLALSVFAFSAHAEVTLPTTGVNMADYITAGITAMGLIVAAALGGYTAFLLVRKAFRWLGRALG